MFPLQKLNVTIVYPHFVGHQLVTRIICITLKHFCEGECCDNDLENLGVGQKEESC